MSKALSNLPTPMLAVLAVGAVWWLSQRRAGAAPASSSSPRPVYGTDDATRYGSATMVSPSGVVPAVNPLSAVLGFALSLLGRATAPKAQPIADRPPEAADYRFGGPSVGVYGAPMAEGQIPRIGDYVPTWTPDSTGEAVARDYYLTHLDEFAASPSPIFWTEPVPTTGGFLDSK